MDARPPADRWYQPVKEDLDLRDVLQTLQHTLNHKKKLLKDSESLPEEVSYVLQLYHKGIDTMGKKITEEAGEVLLAAKDLSHHGSEKEKKHLVSEITDLWFHSLVLLSYYDGDVNEILTEIKNRLGISGIDEKANRKSPVTP